MTWKTKLSDKIPAELGQEIDAFENQISLRRQDKVDEKVFAETRLRRGVYGQRYDNGQRNDGSGPKPLAYPSNGLTKGPETVWDAPGMMRIKIPMGRVNPDQMDVLADLADEYSDEICHITTRQDIQLHFVHIDDTPDLMRRLAAVGITTREACGNTVRNVTGCPLAGVCRDETFDVTPYAEACMSFLLGHPDTQDFGRKFKVSFSGCQEHACGLASMHDLGLIAVTRTKNGIEQRGFETYVGGGLGAVPHQAKLFDEFLPVEELLPIAQAIARVFARLGEKRNRARARVKFLVAQLGLEEFKRVVLEERAKLPDDPRWTAYLSNLSENTEQPIKTSHSGDDPGTSEYQFWLRTNCYQQRQDGYSVITIALPLGDLTSQQLRQLAQIARTYIGDSVRLTVEQNIVLRWVNKADLPSIYQALVQAGLAQPGAGTIADITACPGTDTCKLGIASSRGLSAELQSRFIQKGNSLPQPIEQLRIKTSGCFNSCGQHHIADLGFYGVSRKINGYAVPHFQVVLGGQWLENAGAYGLASVAIPSKHIPEAVDRITKRFADERNQHETFQDYTKRIGRRDFREMLSDLTTVPTHDVEPAYYSDWGDPREFSLGDMGVGECAGEVVSLTDFDLAAAEAEIFEAQIKLEENVPTAANQLAYNAMLLAAKGLVKSEFIDISDDPDSIVEEFRARFFDTEVFFDKYARGKFAMYLFRRHATGPRDDTTEAAHQLIEEAQLFIEASHACNARLTPQVSSTAPSNTTT